MESRRHLTALLFFLLASSVNLVLSAEVPPPSSELVELDSAQGMRLMSECSAAQAFYRLVRYFIPQKNLTYCGVASSVMVLNALPVTRPADEAHGPYPFFTQENFFTAAASAVKAPAEVAQSGLSLQELTDMLNAHQGIKAVHTYATRSTLEHFRQLAKTSLNEKNEFILINYLRKAVGQKSGGHISPLAAYHEKADLFLILDVSQYKYPPVWIPAATLWNAMSQIDDGEHLSRGFVMVRTR